MRSQPPFLTDLILQVFAQLDPARPEENRAWLKRAMQGAIREYHSVWMAEPRLHLGTGLSRYRPGGVGIPPETEASHFTTVLQPFADKFGISVNEFNEKYNAGEVNEPKLDEYFLHDRAVRESGHDCTYRCVLLLESDCCGDSNLGLFLIQVRETVCESRDDRFMFATLQVRDRYWHDDSGSLQRRSRVGRGIRFICFPLRSRCSLHSSCWFTRSIGPPYFNSVSTVVR